MDTTHCSDISDSIFRILHHLAMLYHGTLRLRWSETSFLPGVPSDRVRKISTDLAHFRGALPSLLGRFFCKLISL